MYTLVRRFIEAGIDFLFAGLGVGARVIVRRELFGVSSHPHLVSAHTHAVQLGFVMFVEAQHPVNPGTYRGIVLDPDSLHRRPISR